MNHTLRVFSGRTIGVWTALISLIALVWAYWGAFLQMADRWGRDPEYSHGYLVPLLAGVLLWYRHDKLEMGPRGAGWLGLIALASGVVSLFAAPAAVLQTWGWVFAGVAILGALWLLRPETLQSDRLRPSWWGLPLLAAGIALRLFAGYYYIDWFDHLSLIPSLAGIVLLTVGWQAFRWSWPALLFVVFMMPLPFTLEGMLRGPLRYVGTKVSTFLMQTLGLPAFADGNRHEILVGGMTQRIGVNEACSGLSMLMIFFALSTAVAFVTRRPWWERAVVLASAIPVALASNISRITLTGVMLYALEDRRVYLGSGSFALIDMPGTQFAQSFFHDWAGWMMMPLALAMMWLELAILKRLVVVEEEVPLSARLSGGRRAPASAQPHSTAKKPAKSRDRSEARAAPNVTVATSVGSRR